MPHLFARRCPDGANVCGPREYFQTEIFIVFTYAPSSCVSPLITTIRFITEHKYNKMRHIIKILIAFFISLLTIWFLGAFLLTTPTICQKDEIIGLPIPIPGTMKRERKENWNTFYYGELGLEASDAQRVTSTSPKILLFGDSYVEANMVAPEDRIQAQLSAMGTPCIGIGISGNRCVEYNHLMNIYDHIISNVHTNILLIADISDILPPNKTTDFKSLRPVYPFRKIEGKLGFLSYRLRLMAFRNILKKTEICFRNGLDFTGNHWRREKTYTLDTSSHKQYYEAYWRDMLNTLKISSNDKKLLIVYVPIVPRIQNNAIITEDKETEIFKQFDKVSHEFGLVGNGILNLEKRFCDFTLTTHQFPRGFFNTCPGEGHLNADGHRIVAEAIIEELLK